MGDLHAARFQKAYFRSFIRRMYVRCIRPLRDGAARAFSWNEERKTMQEDEETRLIEFDSFNGVRKRATTGRGNRARDRHEGQI